MDIHVQQKDITTLAVDAIVNAANSSLLGGGGVDGAIHAAAGPRLLQECRRIRKTQYPQGLPIGDAVATGGYDLPARWVIHTVGPNWHRGQRDPSLLASCYRNSLQRAHELSATSIAFPAISAGAYGWDVTAVAGIAVAAVRQQAVAWLATDEPVLPDTVIFATFDATATAAFQQALQQ